MPDPLYWRCVYADDTAVTEPLDNASIRLRPRGAVELHVVPHPDTPLGQGVLRIDLRPNWLPIFYRRRSAVLNGSGTPRLDATVFGRARTAPDGSCEATLWCAVDGRISDCPAYLIDRVICEEQLAL